MAKVSTLYDKNKTLAEHGEHLMDWFSDFIEMCGPLVKVILMGGTCAINWWAGKVLSDGGLLLPIIFLGCDLAGFYFYERSKSLVGGASVACVIAGMMLMFGSAITALGYSFYMDAKAKSFVDPVYIGEIKKQLDEAENDLENSEDGSLEKMVAQASVTELRERYLNEVGKQSVKLDYNPKLAFFYVMPFLNRDPELSMALVRAYFILCFVGSAFLLPMVGGGNGRRRRLDDKMAQMPPTDGPDGTEPFAQEQTNVQLFERVS